MRFPTPLADVFVGTDKEPLSPSIQSLGRQASNVALSAETDDPTNFHESEIGGELQSSK